MSLVLIAVSLDMMGCGLILPVLPALIGQVGQLDLARAAVIGAWMFCVFAAAGLALVTAPSLWLARPGAR